MYLVINKCVTAVKVSDFSGHYLRNRSTLDTGVLGYIGIVQHKEHSPEVLHIPPGTPCISTFDDQQLAYLGSDVILRLSLCLGVRAVIYFSRRATVGTHNYRRLFAELEDTIVLPVTCLTVCAVLLTP